MKIRNFLPKVGSILFIIIAMASCQEDISTIGSEILGTEIPNGILYDSSTIISYSKKLPPVQTNRLPAYQLGVYNDPVYGKSSVNLLSQLTLSSNDPKFGENAVLDSAFVYVPYFSTASTTDSVTTYTLDSIYGNSPINVTISQSNFFLRDYDPNTGFEEFQNYYSDQSTTFEQNLLQVLGQVENFIPSPEGFVFNAGEEDEEKLAPGFRVRLDSTFFDTNIINMAGSPELRNNNNFKDFMRGIYFNVESPSNDGSLFIFDAAKANVTLYYSFDDTTDPEVRDHSTFTLNFGGVNVNTFKNELPGEIEMALENADTINGNENLYMRGGAGIISVIELFGEDVNGNGVADELETLREKKWLINEANLIFYVNKDLMVTGNTEPERIIIYDLKNNNVLVDYNLDYTNGLEPINAINVHLGKLERGNDDAGDYYKLKLTSHISNLINNATDNVRLGVIVTQNVLTTTTQDLLNPLAPGVKEVPAGAVISPEGTVLYGNNSPNQEKRLKLQIYYTEPN